MIIDKMEKDELTYHVPVLLKESVDGMNIQPDGTYVDVTFGGAGHSREILSRLGEGGRLLGFDQDEDAERNIVNILLQEKTIGYDLHRTIPLTKKIQKRTNILIQQRLTTEQEKRGLCP